MRTVQLGQSARRLTWLAALVLSACGGGNALDDSAKTASSAAADSSADARQRAQAAPSSLAVKITTAPDPLLQNLTIPADAATRGMWSTIQKWPLNAAHLALLPDGKVLSYGTAPGQPNVPNGRSFDFWTPSAGFGTAAHRLVSMPNGADTFGSSAAQRKDGNLVIVGGVSTRSTTLVRWATGEVVDEGSKLIDDRWYATAMTQQDGSIYVAAGMTANSEAIVLGNGSAGSLAGVRSYNTEEYRQGAGWSSVTASNASNGETVFSIGLNSASPQVWVSPLGEPFGLAGSQEWHHSFPVFSQTYFTPGPDLGEGVQGAPFGALAAAALVRPGEILFAGGGSSNANDGAAATEKAALLDTNPYYDPSFIGTSFGVKPIYLPSMAFARRAANATLMADGQLVVTGGTRLGNASDEHAVRAAEIFNPVSRTWMTAASASAPRVHHSAALLLPNGAVLTAGGGVMTDAGREDAEVFYPPYLFRTVNGVAQLATRPVITGINALNFGHGGAVKVELAAGHKASRIRLVRAGTVSRGFNNGQRPIELAVTQSGDTISTVMPINPALAPPGHYLLHVINEAGVPSVAQIVGLGLEGSTNVVVPLVSPYAVMSLRSIGSPDLVLSGQGAGAAGLVASPASQPVPASAELMLTWRWYDRDPGEFIDPNVGERCYFIRQRASTNGAPRWLQADAASTSTYNWVNFQGAFSADLLRSVVCLEPSPIGRGFLLRPRWDPSKLMRVVNGKLRLEKEKATTAFITSASFELNLLRVLPPLEPVISYTPFPFPKTIPFGARIQVTATATDPDGVKLITLRECSDLQVRKSSTTGTVTYDWRPGVGRRSLCIRAVDTIGYESYVSDIPFDVLPNALPTVSLTAPSNGTVLVTGQAISLTSQASDADGPIQRVEFFDGTKLIGTASAAPWSVTWTPTAGSHTLTAKAVDNSDVSTTSAAVVVTAAP